VPFLSENYYLSSNVVDPDPYPDSLIRIGLQHQTLDPDPGKIIRIHNTAKNPVKILPAYNVDNRMRA
jgi:hypothetical protein